MVWEALPIKSSRSAVRYVSTAGDASGPRLWVSLAGIRSGYPGRFCTERSLQVPLGGGGFRGRDCAHRRERERTGERFGDAGASRHAWRRRGAVRSCLLCIATRGRLSINGEAQWGGKRSPAMDCTHIAPFCSPGSGAKRWEHRDRVLLGCGYPGRSLKPANHVMLNAVKHLSALRLGYLSGFTSTGKSPGALDGRSLQRGR